MRFLDVIRFLRVLLRQRWNFIGWSIVLAVSALGPIINVYLITELINTVAEEKAITSGILTLLGYLLLVNFFDNVLRLLSKTRLSIVCFAIEYNTQEFLLRLISSEKVSRERIFQAVTNLTDALRNLLLFIKENGIVAITQFIVVPAVLFSLDKRIFLIELAYIVVYLTIDYLTTRRYKKKIDVVNNKLEDYFESVLKNEDNPPKKKLLNAFAKRENFSFWEWSFLQHLSKFVYFFVIVISILEIANGRAEVGIILLYSGYITQTQGFLNVISSLYDRITDVNIALQRISEEGEIEVSHIMDNISQEEIT